MKAKYIFIGIALASVMCACNRDEASLFETSAAERAQAALDNAFDILTAPENGWEMIYFANTESEGYNILVKFDEHGRVDATAKNSLTTNKKLMSDSSTWVVMNDYGPILSFDTYNEVLHAWADPGTNGNGYLGDYEFLILHADANYVKLKGKKHSAYCYLFPLQKGMTKEQYFSNIESMQAKFFSNNSILHLKVNSGEYLLHSGGSGIFMLSPLGKQPDADEPEIYPFATRLNGLHFMFGPRCEDIDFEFKNNALVVGANKIFANSPAGYITEFMTLSSGSWIIDKDTICDTSKDAIAAIDAKLKKAYPKNKKAAVESLKLKKSGEKYILVFGYYGSNSKSATTMNYVFSVAQSGNSLKLAYVEPADENAQKTINAFPEIETLFNTLGGSFSLAPKEVINPSIGMTLTNTSNSALWMHIAGKI